MSLILTIPSKRSHRVILSILFMADILMLMKVSHDNAQFEQDLRCRVAFFRGITD